MHLRKHEKATVIRKFRRWRLYFSLCQVAMGQKYRVPKEPIGKLKNRPIHLWFYFEPSPSFVFVGVSDLFLERPEKAQASFVGDGLCCAALGWRFQWQRCQPLIDGNKHLCNLQPSLKWHRLHLRLRYDLLPDNESQIVDLIGYPCPRCCSTVLLNMRHICKCFECFSTQYE